MKIPPLFPVTVLFRRIGPLLAAAILIPLAGGCVGPEDQALHADPVLSVAAATVPSAFSDEVVASGLASPTALEIAPDGRIFICEKVGRLRIVRNGALLSRPFLTVNPRTEGERGLLGMALDPDFPATPHVYVYYTSGTPTVHNRVCRFTVSAGNADVADPASELVIFDLDNLSSATNHNGGAIHFGPDGKLYIASGENALSGNSQNMGNVLGKLLRINKDGSIPADNPFLASTTGRNRSIWAKGLRNPYTFSFQPGTGRLLVNDVGEGYWEEINDGIAGANYGWPQSEGATTRQGETTPLYTYNHSGGYCAITGAAFYNPASMQFPPEYAGDFFFGDFCGNTIRRMDLSTRQVSAFASGVSGPVDVKVEPAGTLLYLSYNTGTLGRITYTGSSAPAISQHPANATVSVGGSATFTVAASGAPPLSYQWRRNGADIAGATASSYTLNGAQAADDGTRFRCVVGNASGSATSNEATLTVTTNHPPVATIATPAAGATYNAGQTISYSGSATDTEDGTLPDAAFSWTIVFHHDTHSHPFLGPFAGRSGSFTIPTQGETAHNVWYRILLKVTDSQGMVNTVYRDVNPNKAVVTLASSPSGLQLLLDGQPVAAPHTFTGVVGMQRTIEAPSPQSSGGASWQFQAWSDAGTRSHVIATPASPATFTATFQNPAGSGSPTATLVTPAAGTRYQGLQRIDYSGTGTDPEEGDLPASAFTWKVDFISGSRVTPYRAPTTGSKTGYIYISAEGDKSPQAFYRFYLTVRDGSGLTQTVTRDIMPITVVTTLEANPTGLRLLLDGVMVTAPHTFTGVAGIRYGIEAVSPQVSGNRNWEWVSWSDAGARFHNFFLPTTSQTYTATFREIP